MGVCCWVHASVSPWQELFTRSISSLPVCCHTKNLLLCPHQSTSSTGVQTTVKSAMWGERCSLGVGGLLVVGGSWPLKAADIQCRNSSNNKYCRVNMFIAFSDQIYKKNRPHFFTENMQTPRVGTHWGREPLPLKIFLTERLGDSQLLVKKKKDF